MEKLKYQIEIDEYLKSIGNDELVSNTISMAGGDDYDGYFTARGRYEFDAYYKELEKRLLANGFFNATTKRLTLSFLNGNLFVDLLYLALQNDRFTKTVCRGVCC